MADGLVVVRPGRFGGIAIADDAKPNAITSATKREHKTRHPLHFTFLPSHGFFRAHMQDLHKRPSSRDNTSQFGRESIVRARRFRTISDRSCAARWRQWQIVSSTGTVMLTVMKRSLSLCLLCLELPGTGGKVGDNGSPPVPAGSRICFSRHFSGLRPAPARGSRESRPPWRASRARSSPAAPGRRSANRLRAPARPPVPPPRPRARAPG